MPQQDLSPHPTVPVIVLASGQPLKVERVFLYETARIEEIASMKATAAQGLGGVQTGIGFWGSPAWTLGGAAALGIVEGILSSAARNRALEILRSCQEQYREMLRRGAFFEARQITDIHLPHPLAWAAVGRGGGRYSHDGDDFVQIGTDTGAVSIRWSNILGYFPPQQPLSGNSLPDNGLAPGGFPRRGIGPGRLETRPISEWKPPS